MKYICLLLVLIGCETPSMPPAEPDDIPENRITFITDWSIVDTTLIIIPQYRLMPRAVTSARIHIEVTAAGKTIYNGTFTFGDAQYDIPWKHRTQVQLATAYVLK